MERLNRRLISDEARPRADLKAGYRDELPEKVLQFGEGVFLRGFTDWMLNRMNEQGLFMGKAVIVQPRGQGKIQALNDQDGLYTLFLRGIQKGEVVQSKELITSISRGIDLYSDYGAFLKLAESPEMRIVVSNTTEAGITYVPGIHWEDAPPASFPAKLTVFLYKRYQAFRGDPAKGLIILPCELIERNGDNLKRIVLQHAHEWNLDNAFVDWLERSNYFLNTLVDRIVTGYPKDEIEVLARELGYDDQLLNTGELYHLWVIEGDRKLASELPFTQAGLNVIWTEDMTPYRTRKVRILNGGHTMMALAAFLCGRETVKECMDDALIRSYMLRGIDEEIIPTLDSPADELTEYANSVVERFENPFIKHYLINISLNSISKFKARVLPSILEYVKRKGHLPKMLAFSFAAMLVFYKGNAIMDGSLTGSRMGKDYPIKDDLSVLQLFKELWSGFDGTRQAAEQLVSQVLSKESLWGVDLNKIEGFSALVSAYAFDMIAKGVESVMKELLER